VDIQLDRHGRPLLTQFSEEGFVDCVFRIENLTTDAGVHALHLVASYDGNLVELDVEVRRGMRGGFDSDMDLIPGRAYPAAVVFRRAGASSDVLLRALAAEYGLDKTPGTMVERFAFTGILLHDDGVDLETMPTKIKLFGHDEPEALEEDYFESYFNLDLGHRIAFWNEKDPDYRSPLIRGLSAGTAGP